MARETDIEKLQDISGRLKVIGSELCGMWNSKDKMPRDETARLSYYVNECHHTTETLIKNLTGD